MMFSCDIDRLLISIRLCLSLAIVVSGTLVKAVSFVSAIQTVIPSCGLSSVEVLHTIKI